MYYQVWYLFTNTISLFWNWPIQRKILYKPLSSFLYAIRQKLPFKGTLSANDTFILRVYVYDKSLHFLYDIEIIIKRILRLINLFTTTTYNVFNEEGFSNGDYTNWYKNNKKSYTNLNIMNWFCLQKKLSNEQAVQVV